MSHFTVLVVGADPEKQLAPFHEFECTGEDDQFVQDVDITTEIRKTMNEHKEFSLVEALDWHGYADRVVASEALINRNKDHKYGYAVVTAEGVLVKVVRRTNPKAKWDWYQLGGRWTGFFRLKEGAKGETGSPGIMTEPASSGYADAMFKGDIDIAVMRSEAAGEARVKYRDFFATLNGSPVPRSFEQVKAAHPELKTREEILAVFHAQEGWEKLRKNDRFFFIDAEDFQCTEEEFLQRARDNALVTFALVKDGQWYERGEMGWWGCVSDEKDKGEWLKEFNALIDGLSDDTLLSVYDCHI